MMILRMQRRKKEKNLRSTADCRATIYHRCEIKAQVKRNRDGRADSTIANINVEMHVRARVIEGRWRGCEWRKQGAKGRSAEG